MPDDTSTGGDAGAPPADDAATGSSSVVLPRASSHSASGSPSSPSTGALSPIGSTAESTTGACGAGSGREGDSPVPPPLLTADPLRPSEAGCSSTTGGRSPFGAAVTGAADPVISRMESMISAFLVRLFAFRPSALAIARSWSLSFDSRTDCSSASAATRVTSLHAGLGRCPDVSVLRRGCRGRWVTVRFSARVPRRRRPTIEERSSLVRHPDAERWRAAGGGTSSVAWDQADATIPAAVPSRKPIRYICVICRRRQAGATSRRCADSYACPDGAPEGTRRGWCASVGL